MTETEEQLFTRFAESVGEPYVALLLAQLANHGLIDLNDPLLKQIRPVCAELVGRRLLGILSDNK